MSTIENYPVMRPRVLLDFANSAGADPRIQCRRASSATCFGPDGKLRTVAANVPRIDYSPLTGKCSGLLIEESRTNFFLQSSNLGHAAWLKSSAISVSAEADDWWDIALNGLSNNAGIYQVGVPTASKSVSFSFDLKPGSLNHANMLLGFNGSADSARVVFDLGGGTSNLTYFAGAITADMVTHKLVNMGTYWRCTVNVDASASSIVASTNLCQLYPGGVANVQEPGNIKARRPQLESGFFPTSYIQTDGAAVTRAADLIDMELSSPLRTIGAIQVDVANIPSPIRGDVYLWLITSPAVLNDDIAYLFYSGVNGRTSWWVNSAATGQSGSNIPGYYSKLAFGFDAAAATAALTSATRVASDTSARPHGFPANLTKLMLGRSRLGAGFLNGCIARLAIYSGPVSTIQLQRISA